MIVDKFPSVHEEDVSIKSSGEFDILLKEIESFGLKVNEFYRKNKKWFFLVDNARVLSSKRQFLLNSGYTIDDRVISK